jgi:two-component system LytT family response regulator
MYTAIIIDDEDIGGEALCILLNKYCPEINVLAISNSAVEGVQMVKKLQPQMLFLDIEIPEFNGFEVLKQLKSESFEFIFTTAHEDYLMNAIKVNALDYLLKPIGKEELIFAVDKAKTRIDKGSYNVNKIINSLAKILPAPVQDKFSIVVGGEVFFVNLNEVIYFEADSNYTHIYLIGGKKITTSKTLKKIEESILHSDFLRIHNSYIINIKNVIKYNKGLVKRVVMKNGIELEVSRAKVNQLVDRLKSSFPQLF